MKSTFILIFLIALVLGLNSQSNKFDLGWSFMYGYPDFIIKGKQNQSGSAKKLQYSIDEKNYLSSGVELKKQIDNNLIFKTGLQLSFLSTNQFAKGALFGSDFTPKCLLHDSCSSINYKLYDFLFKVPVEVGTSFFNDKLKISLGLNSYVLALSHYEYSFNESGIDHSPREAFGRNFTEFPSRYNLSAFSSIGFKAFNYLELMAFYEYFFSDHLLVAPLLHTKLINFGLKIIYWPEFETSGRVLDRDLMD